MTDSAPDNIPDVAEEEAEAIAHEISAKHVEEEGRLTAQSTEDDDD